MPPLFVSSGDADADRRYRDALDHLVRGDAAAAAEALSAVVAATPGFATAWFALACIREQTGVRDGAVAAFEAACAADPDDYHGARLHLARLGIGDRAPAMSEAYIRRLFDQHAPEFDRALLERLDYRAPDILLDAVRQAVGSSGLGSVLDLGCGTGLAGAAFRPHCDQLVGVDLSPAMIEQARKKGLYDRLIVADITTFMIGEAGASHHLVMAADVFVYCNSLAPIVRAAAHVLAPGGLFAFTVETDGRPGVRLQPTLRYAHGADHLRFTFAAAGLTMLHLAAVSTRNEKGEPVPGLVAVAALGESADP